MKQFKQLKTCLRNPFWLIVGPRQSSSRGILTVSKCFAPFPKPIARRKSFVLSNGLHSSVVRLGLDNYPVYSDNYPVYSHEDEEYSDDIAQRLRVSDDIVQQFGGDIEIRGKFYDYLVHKVTNGEYSLYRDQTTSDLKYLVEVFDKFIVENDIKDVSNIEVEGRVFPDIFNGRDVIFLRNYFNICVKNNLTLIASW